MGRTRSRVLLGACLAAFTTVSVASAEDGDQYALLVPRRPSQSSESTTEPPTSAASEMTLQPPTTDQSPLAPELPPEAMEPAPEIPLAPKGYTGPSPYGRSLAQDDFVPIPDRWRIGFPTGYRPETGGFGK